MGIRAAQFSPFAALTGYDDEIENTSKVRVLQDDLSEEEKEKLDYNLNALFQMIQERPEVSVTFFQQELEEAGKTMEVHNVNDLIRDVFDVTGFLDILTIV